jgi:hypothetical protein
MRSGGGIRVYGLTAAMRLLLVSLVVLLLLAAAFFAYPPLIEGSDGACSALEQRLADSASHDSSGLLIVGSLYGSSSSAPSAAAFAKDRHPLLPGTVGCTIEYWKALLNPSPPAPAAPPQPSPASEPSAEPKRASNAVVSTIARGITPNGDPISPATVFSLPMDSVAIRVDYPSGGPNVGRFQLLQGRAVIASCNADKSAPGTAWCQFNTSLRKGNYSIAFFANNALVGQFPFTVIGR